MVRFKLFVCGTELQFESVDWTGFISIDTKGARVQIKFEFILRHENSIKTAKNSNDNLIFASNECVSKGITGAQTDLHALHFWWILCAMHPTFIQKKCERYEKNERISSFVQPNDNRRHWMLQLFFFLIFGAKQKLLRFHSDA